MTIISVYFSIKSELENSTDFEELEVIYTHILDFEKKYNDGNDVVLIKRLYMHYENTILRLCGNN